MLHWFKIYRRQSDGGYACASKLERQPGRGVYVCRERIAAEVTIDHIAVDGALKQSRRCFNGADREATIAIASRMASAYDATVASENVSDLDYRGEEIEPKGVPTARGSRYIPRRRKSASAQYARERPFLRYLQKPLP